MPLNTNEWLAVMLKRAGQSVGKTFEKLENLPTNYRSFPYFLGRMTRRAKLAARSVRRQVNRPIDALTSSRRFRVLSIQARRAMRQAGRSVATALRRRGNGVWGNRLRRAGRGLDHYTARGINGLARGIGLGLRGAGRGIGAMSGMLGRNLSGPVSGMGGGNWGRIDRNQRDEVLNRITRLSRGGIALSMLHTGRSLAGQTGVDASGPTGSVAGTLSQGFGAASSLASSRTMAASLGVAGVVAGLASAPKVIRDFTSSMVESRRTLAETNGKYAVSFANMDVDRLKRNVTLGTMTGDSSAKMTKALSNLEEKLLPVAALSMNVMSEITTSVVKIAEMSVAVVETIPFLKEYVEWSKRAKADASGLTDFARQIAEGKFLKREKPPKDAKPPAGPRGPRLPGGERLPG